MTPTSLYASQNKAFSNLGDDGDLYLVTVRPPGQLCLVAVLERPRHGDDGWSAAPNTTPIRDIDALRTRLTFVGGAALPSDVAKLGMSLQTPRVLTAEAVALLRGPAARGAAAKAPAPRKAATTTGQTEAKAKATTVPARAEPVRGQTNGAESIAQALQTGNDEKALAAMLSVWKSAPSVELSALITATSNAARVEVPNVGGKKKALEAWAAAAQNASELEKPALLDRLADAASRDAMERLDAVAEWLPDPRVDELFVRLLETPPYTSTGARVFFTRLFTHMERFSDPSLLERLEGADAKLGRLTSDMEWHRGKLKKLLGSISPRLKALPRAPHLAALGGAKKPDTAKAKTASALLEAVYEDPTSDSARAVYADALSDAGDPRGEFITVQLGLAKNPTDAGLRKREKQLHDAHGLQWLGPLAQFVKTRHRFERGFLAEAVIDFKLGERADELAGLPVWSTVHTFDGPANIGLHSVMRSLRSLGFSVNADGSERAGELLAGTTRPIEVLRLVGDHPSALTCPALPRLRDLTVKDDLPFLVTLLTSPVAKRLERLALGFWVMSSSGADVAAWVSRLAPVIAKATPAELAFLPRPYDMEQSFRLFRGPSGYTRASIEVGTDRQVGNTVWSSELVGMALEFVRQLPLLESVEVKLRKHTEPVDRAAMVAGLKALKLKEVKVT